jgi:hypothetical protein
MFVSVCHPLSLLTAKTVSLLNGMFVDYNGQFEIRAGVLSE